MLEEQKAKELQRQQQQGLGRPIISTDFRDHKIVAVGSAVHWGKWKTFFDFLSDYIKSVVGRDWGNAEIAKPLHQRHPIMRWYDAVCHYQQAMIEPGKVRTATMTGATAAYFGLAYSLYLLAHNVELQRKLVARLKNPDQFQGAYYETLVAAWFILSAFELTLENESDVTDSHCEFSAKSKRTGAMYSVEAKSRGPNKNHLDVGTQLARALHKTAAHQRIVMIDVNAPNDPPRSADVWLNEVMTAIQRRETTLTVKAHPAPAAFVVVTNHPYHYDLEGPASGMAVMAGGFKIPDLGLGDRFTTVKEAFQTKRKYADIFALIDVIRNYRIPSTFDGEVPEFAFGEAERKWRIGERYDLADAAPGRMGLLTAGTVSTAEKVAYLALQLDDGQNIVMTAPMSDAEISAYNAHPETFFGVVSPVGKRLDSPLELFEWLYESYRQTPRARILGFTADWPDAAELAQLSDDDLLLAYVDRMASATIGAGSSS